MKIINWLTAVILNIAVTTTTVSPSCVQSRPNIYYMKDAERSRFINAVKKLNEGPRPTKWDHFSWIHNKYFWDVHSEPVFFAWHRVYLSMMEAELMKIDKSIRIPYWDWTVFFNRTYEDPVYDWFGKTGKETKPEDPKNLCVPDGQFQDFRIYYYNDLRTAPKEHCYTRQAEFPMLLSANHSYINKAIIDERDARKFWTRMEDNPHAEIHINIGEDFSDQSNANDPLFWLHHSFIDKIWFDRQKRYPELFRDYPAPDDTKLPYFNKTVGNLFDTRSMCYDYKQDRFVWTRPRSSESRSAESEEGLPQPEKFEPLVKDLQNTKVPDEEIEKHAMDYLFKDILLPSDPNLKLKPGCQIFGPKRAIPVMYIRKMKKDQIKIRENQRMEFLMMDRENRKCLK